MSEAKHTPGPWVCQAQSGPQNLTFKRQYWVIGSTVTGHGVGIAFGDGPGEPDDANARLIAAAPDLLAALREMTPVFNTARVIMNSKEARDLAGEFVERARAAIAKAEGRS